MPWISIRVTGTRKTTHEDSNCSQLRRKYGKYHNNNRNASGGHKHITRLTAKLRNLSQCSVCSHKECDTCKIVTIQT